MVSRKECGLEPGRVDERQRCEEGGDDAEGSDKLHDPCDVEIRYLEETRWEYCLIF